MSSPIPTTHLGGTANDVIVARVAHGLMLMTWKTPVVPDEQAFEAIKAGVDSIPSDAKVLINSGEFYGIDPTTANLELVARFSAKYPEYAKRLFISVKGANARDSLRPDSSPENLRASVDTIIKCLGTKRLDLFEPARVDPRVPIEESIATLKGLVQEGKFDHIGLSEVSADTLRRACKIHPIAAVEIEVSPWAYEEETRKVIATAKELGVTVVAYAPLGRGFLTNKIKLSDIGQGDFRLIAPRFQAENEASNQAFVDALTKIAERKGISNAQLCIAWVASLGDHVIPLPGSSAVTRTKENFAAGAIQLTEEDKAEVDAAIKKHEIKGGRYPEGMAVWG